MVAARVKPFVLFQISRDTIYRWLNADDLRPKKHGLRNRKLDKAALRRHVEEHPDLFLHERAEIFGVHTSSISRALKTLGIVKKRAPLPREMSYEKAGVSRKTG